MEAEIAFRMLDLLYWKLVHNALPVKEKLVKRQIISSACAGYQKFSLSFFSL